MTTAQQKVPGPVSTTRMVVGTVVCLGLVGVLAWVLMRGTNLELGDETVRAQLAADQKAGVVAARKHEPMVVGMNLGEVVDYSTEWAFVDVFRHSRAWIAQRPGTSDPWSVPGETIEVDASGWPLLKAGQAAGTLMCREISGHYPAGRYVCEFAGHGKLSFGMDAHDARAAGGMVEFQVKPGDGGIYLRVDESDPADPVRDIRVWMPGFWKSKELFHPTFLDRLRPFGVLRFMEWQRTNDSVVRTWAGRSTPASARQSGPEGVCVEYMVALCNELGAEPWFCMPHTADEQYVREFAKLVKAQLAPGRRVWVEWSNETWNGIYSQGRWVAAEASRRGVSEGKVAGERCRDTFKVWREVFGEERGRVRCVAAGHLYNERFAEDMMTELKGDCDALSCSAYAHVSPEAEAKFDATTTPEDVIAQMRRTIIEKDLPQAGKHHEIAQRWEKQTGKPIALVAYEGGQHLDVRGRGNAPYAQAYYRAQSHPKMKLAYGELLDGFEKNGGELFVAYQYVRLNGKWGAFGHLEYQDQPEALAPKYQAVAEKALKAAKPARIQN